MIKKRNYLTIQHALDVVKLFNNKRDFKIAHSGAYELLRKNNLLDEACIHMENLKHKSKWTFEKCKEEALKYKTKIEFKKKCSWGYSVAKKMGWLDDITSHTIKIKHKKPIKWTFEKCKEEALKYSNRNDFNTKSPKAYNASVRNKWLDEICIHMNKSYTTKFKWSKEKCQKIALKYQYRKEFQKKDKNAYFSALYNGWLNDICSHMKYKKLPNKYWYNYDNCKNEALKYKTKKDFIKKSEHTYNISLKNGWIDDICKHMLLCGDKKNKCVYSYEFPDNHVYVGLTYNLDVREKSRMYDNKDAVVIYMNKSNLKPIRKQLTEYISADVASKLEGEYLCKYINDGWIPLNRSKTGGLGGSSSVFNFNRVKKMVKKYNDINSLKNDDIFLFEIIKDNNWIDLFFPNEI